MTKQNKQSLAETHPALAAQWHPTLNGTLTSADVTPGSGKQLWWLCEKGHNWKATVASRAKGSGCPYCAGQRATAENNLAVVHPEIATQWHPTLNEGLTPADVTLGSDKQCWWRCEKGHSWKSGVGQRVRGSGCPYCAGQRATAENNLAVVHPEIAAQWHPTLNEGLAPVDVLPKSNKQCWWLCEKGHSWRVTVAGRTKSKGCPYCAGKRTSSERNLSVVHPEIAAQWHPTLNEGLTPVDVLPMSSRSVWWLCKYGHSWEAIICNRFRGNGCPYCAGQRATAENNLAIVYPEIAAQWHPTLNEGLTPADVMPKSSKQCWWLCEKGHSWKATVSKRSNGGSCPYCIGKRADKDNNLAVVYPEIAAQWHPIQNENLTPADVVPGSNRNVWWQCEQKHEWKAPVARRTKGSGCPHCYAVNHSRFGAFISILGNISEALRQTVAVVMGQPLRGVAALGEHKSVFGEFASPIKKRGDAVQKALAAISAFEEAGHTDVPWAFLIAHVTDQIWQAVEEEGPEVLQSLAKQQGGDYVRQVVERVQGEQVELDAYCVPAFLHPSDRHGAPIVPRLMQKLAAIRLRRERVYGNYARPGGGKTLAALLAAAEIPGTGPVVVVSPNNVVERWREAIEQSHPGARIIERRVPRPGEQADYLLYNVEWFQRPGAPLDVGLLAEVGIRCLVLDEVHIFRQREGLFGAKSLSRRRAQIERLRVEAERVNPNIAVLGLSGTPVVNELREGWSLVELLRGKAYPDAPTWPTASNALRLHWALLADGMRWGAPGVEPPTVELPEVDAHAAANALLALRERALLARDERGQPVHPLEVEQALFPLKLPAILKAVRPGTIVYTQFVKGIVEPLVAALRAEGWRVGVFTGEERTGLKQFVGGEVDVLVASSTLELGVDGLQDVADRMVFVTLPWTHTSYEQVVARIARPGQTRPVSVVVPITHLTLNDIRWSWDAGRWELLQSKRTLADAVIDGIIPTGTLVSPQKLTNQMLRWLSQAEQAVTMLVSPLTDDLEAAAGDTDGDGVIIDVVSEDVELALIQGFEGEPAENELPSESDITEQPDEVIFDKTAREAAIRQVLFSPEARGLTWRAIARLTGGRVDHKTIKVHYERYVAAGELEPWDTSVVRTSDGRHMSVARIQTANQTRAKPGIES